MLASMQAGPLDLEILLNAEVDVNIADSNGFSPLSWAIFRGDNKSVILLISAGADVNHANKECLTPDMLSAINNNPQCIKILLHKGADVNMLDAAGETAVFKAARRGHAECL